MRRLLPLQLFRLWSCGSFQGAAGSSSDGGPATTSDDGAAPSDGGAIEGDGGAPNADGGTSRSTLYRAEVMVDMPLAYWRMGAVALGALVPDETTNKKGAPDYTAGAPGVFDDDGAIWFAGARGHGVATDSTPLMFDGNAPFTIEMWARRELTDAGASGQNFQSVASLVEGHATPLPGTLNGYMFYLRTDAAPGTFASQGGSDGGAVEAKGPLPLPGVWAHLAMVMDGKIMLVYVDGEQRQSVAVKEVITPRTVQFAIAKQSNDERYFRGFLDEIAVYPKALSPQRIAAHYKIVRP